MAMSHVWDAAVPCVGHENPMRGTAPNVPTHFTPQSVIYGTDNVIIADNYCIYNSLCTTMFWLKR